MPSVVRFKRKKRKIESLSEFEAVIDTLPVSILVLDEGLRTILVNNTFCQTFDFKEEQLIGKSIHELFTSKSIKERKLDRLILKVMQAGKPIEVKEVRGAIPKNLDKILNIRIIGMSQMRAATLLMDDVTDKVYMGEQLRQAAKMSAIGLFTAGIIHEVNNPISIVSGHAQYMLNRLKHIKFDKLTPKDYKECIDTLVTIERESKRIGGITSSLLYFSRKSQVKMVPTDINKNIEDTLHLLEYQLALSDVKITRKIDSRLSMIWGNPDQLQQVFMNLTMNAFQAMPKGGRLTIETLSQKKFAKIIFTNTGKRIPPEHLGRIFEPFFTSKEGTFGTGLGLSIVYSIICAHKGIIEVDSQPGKGTTFTILLPFSKRRR